MGEAYPSEQTTTFLIGLIVDCFEIRMLLLGLALVVTTEIYSAVMQRCFQNSDNRIGKGFAVAGIFLFVVCYCMSLLTVSFSYHCFGDRLTTLL